MRYLIGYGYLFLVFAVMTVVQKVFSLRTEISRKIVHMAIGYTWVNIYRYFILPTDVARWEVLVLPVSFIVINALSYRYKIFKLIEREGEKNHPGTVYYAIAMTVLLGLTIPFPALIVPSGIAVFALSLGDGFAALFGTLFGKYGPRVREDKSFIGSFSCMVGSVGGVYLLKLFVDFSLPFYAVLIIGIATAAFELVGGGLDNFAISFGVTAVSAALLYGELPSSERLLPAFLLAAAIAVLVYFLHGLTMGGAFTAFLIISLSLLFGGYGCFAVLVFAYAVIAVAGKLSRKAREPITAGVSAKSGARDAVQVTVNGLPALVCAFIGCVAQADFFYLAYVAAIAEALGDSLASDIGVLSRKAPVDCLTFRETERGLSGGITLLGTLSAFGGILAVALFSLIFFPVTLPEFLLLLAVPTAAVFLDSVLGSRLQVKFRCVVCGKLTEKTTHCEKATEKVSGLSFLNNDGVNLASGVFAAACAAVLFSLL